MPSSTVLTSIIFQNMLTSTVNQNSLAPDDRLILGMVKIWGAGKAKITEVTLRDDSGKTHTLDAVHDVDTEVSNVCLCYVTLKSAVRLEWHTFSCCLPSWAAVQHHQLQEMVYDHNST